MVMPMSTTLQSNGSGASAACYAAVGLGCKRVLEVQMGRSVLLGAEYTDFWHENSEQDVVFFQSMNCSLLCFFLNLIVTYQHF